MSELPRAAWLLLAGATLGWFCARSFSREEASQAQCAQLTSSELRDALAAALVPLESRLGTMERKLQQREDSARPTQQLGACDSSTLEAGGTSRVAPAPRDPEAMAEALTIVDDARTRGLWTDADREALHLEVSQSGLPDADFAEVMRQLSVAINSKALKVETSGPLF